MAGLGWGGAVPCALGSIKQPRDTCWMVWLLGVYCNILGMNFLEVFSAKWRGGSSSGTAVLTVMCVGVAVVVTAAPCCPSLFQITQTARG